MYVCMYVCEDWMQKAEDDAKGLPDTRDSQLSHQKNPCYRNSWKSIKYVAEIINKTFSFEVNIGLLHLILIILATEPLFSIAHTFVILF